MQSTGANNLPNEIIGKIASMIHLDDSVTLKNGSLVEKRWTEFFQQRLFTEFRVRRPSCDDSPLQDLVFEVELTDQDRLLRFMRTLSFGAPYDLANPTHSQHSKVDPCHLPILIRASNMASLHFCFSTFAWLDLFLCVLNLPELNEFSFFSYPGCYMPLSFFLYTPNIKILKLEDVSCTPVNEVDEQGLGGSNYIKLKNTLQNLPSCPLVFPGLHCHRLALKGLGLVAKFLAFISHLNISSTWPDGPQLTHLNLDCTDSYPPGTAESSKPVASEVVGNLLERLSLSIQQLRLLIEVELTSTSTGNGEEIEASLAIGLGELLRLRSFSLVLRVNTTLVTDAEVLAKFARDQVLSFLEALPDQGRDLTELDIMCQFSLKSGVQENNRCTYKRVLQEKLFEELDLALKIWECTSLRKVTIHVIVYHSDTMLAIRNNPICESNVRLTCEKDDFSAKFSWLAERRNLTLLASLSWDSLVMV